MSKLFIFILMLIGGIVVFVFALMSRKQLKQNKDILAGLRPKDKSDEDNKKGKNKQQIELELLLISNNTILNFLGIMDRNPKFKLFLTSLIFGVYYLFNHNGDAITNGFVFMFIFILVVMIPGIVTGMILKKKIKSIMVDLPGFIDLTAVCVQTGMTIDMSLKRVAMDFKGLNPDLTYVMVRIMRKAELTSLPAALDDLAISLPTKEIRMFTTVLQQSLNFGSSVYGQLIQLSADIRELQLLAIEERLGTLAAKMSIPLIVFIMFPIVILILAPGAMRVFSNVF